MMQTILMNTKIILKYCCNKRQHNDKNRIKNGKKVKQNFSYVSRQK